MCGRFTLRTPLSKLIEQFQASGDFPLQPRYNVAPTQNVLVCRREGGTSRRQLTWMKWGLIPSWSQDPRIGARMINARGETVATKPSFRAAFKRRRCLVLADGYYEWQKSDARTKQPYYIHRPDNEPFAMAGLWETWQDLETCTIITTAANATTAAVHDRMPVILEDVDYDAWLCGDEQPRESLELLLEPAAEDLLDMTPISTYVNKVSHNGPECIAAV